MVGRRVVFCELGTVTSARLSDKSTRLAHAPAATRAEPETSNGLRAKVVSTPVVSVCIVNWNCRELLRACLQSLMVQEIPLEVIVVDNASTDGAADMVEREFPEVILVRNRVNAGFSRANNQAAAIARGRYLFFLNNDTLVPPGALEVLVDFADAHPEAGIVGPRLRDGAGRVQVSCRRLPTAATFISRLALVRVTGLTRSRYRRYRRHDFDSAETRSVEMLMGAAMLIPRKVYDECGGWDEEFTFGGEDLELCRRIGRRYQILYHGAVEVTHYGRSSTRLHAAYAAPNIAIGFLRYLRKSDSGRFSLLLYKLALTVDAPFQLAMKLVQGIGRLASGRRAEAAKSFLSAGAVWHFLSKGLLSFWRA